MNRLTIAASAAALLFCAIPTKAETFCFAYDTGTESAFLVLDASYDDGPVSGVENGTVEDAEQGYYTSWESTIDGERSGDTLEVTIKTIIEGDRQTSSEIWQIDGNSIITSRRTYDRAPCKE